MDIFDDRAFKPMLIGRVEAPFDDPDYIFELKLDGDRCVAYLDSAQTLLINRRGREVLPHVPELASIHKQASLRCILDGELIIGTGRKREFELVRARLTTSNPARLQRLSVEQPATFVTHDMVYLGDTPLLDMPLMERKALMEKNVVESDRLALTRPVRETGIAFFDLVRAQNLEGVVAKKMDSRYLMGKKSRDWVKFKNWVRDCFLVLGWIPKRNDVATLVIAQRSRAGGYVYRGHVSLNSKREEFQRIQALPSSPVPDIGRENMADNRDAVWVAPILVCEVEFVCYLPQGGLRQPIFKAMCDMNPAECLEPPAGDGSVFCHGSA